MDWQSVQSSNLSAIAYNADTRTLYIRFRNDRVYQYADVFPEVHQALTEAHNVGQMFNHLIRGTYTGTEITHPMP